MKQNLQTKTMRNTNIVTYSDETIIKHSYFSIYDMALVVQPVTSHHVTPLLITIIFYYFTTGRNAAKDRSVEFQLNPMTQTPLYPMYFVTLSIRQLVIGTPFHIINIFRDWGGGGGGVVHLPPPPLANQLYSTGTRDYKLLR